jgi:hypothetical protein
MLDKWLLVSRINIRYYSGIKAMNPKATYDDDHLNE